MHQKAFYSTLISFLFVACVLAGCAFPSDQNKDTDNAPYVVGATSGTESAVERTDLAMAINEDEQQIYRPLINQFEHDNPNISIRLVTLDSLPVAPAQSSSQTTVLQRAVQQADVLPAFLVSPTEHASSLILNLKPLLDADASFAIADYYPSVLNQTMTGPRMWMMPSSFRLPLLAYNPERFTQQGVALPRSDWSWRELLVTAEQLASDGGAAEPKYGLLDPSDGVFALSAVLQAQGSALQLQSFDQINVDRPEMVKAIQELQRLVRLHALLLPSNLKADTKGVTNVQQLVADGQIALWPEDAISLQGDPSTQSTTGRVVFPKGENPLAGQLTYGYVISAGTRHPQEAWK